ncbi:MAG: hypothetical protein K2Y37_07760 [Pirellulales bacterium]|nr:hypothetical protein [Pirellulales bacterium]
MARNQRLIALPGACARGNDPFTMPQPRRDEPWRTLDLLIDCSKALPSN